MSKEELSAFAEANDKIKDVRLSIARWHQMCCTDEIHGTPAFLPWHRLMLHVYEVALQHQNPAITVPFWDWDHVDWRIPANYTTEKALQPIDDQGKLLPQGRGHIVEGHKDLLTTSVQNLLLLDPQQFIQKTYSDTQTSGGAHLLVHAWSGETMSTVSQAAYDPLFFIHHAKMDALWSQWKLSKNPPLKACPPEFGFDGLNIYFSDFNDGNKTKYVKASDLWDESNLGYEYASCQNSPGGPLAFSSHFAHSAPGLRYVQFRGLDLSDFAAQNGHHEPRYFLVLLEAGSAMKAGPALTLIAPWPLHDGVRNKINWTAVVPDGLKIDAKSRFVIAPANNLGRSIGAARDLKADEIDVVLRFSQ